MESQNKPVTTEELLDDLFEARCFLDALNLRRKDARDAAIPDEVRSRLLSIDAEFEEPITEQAARVQNMEANIRVRVEAEGCSTKSTHLHAIWMKGRVSWDSKGLEGYSKANPQVLHFRAEGSPSVSLRAVVAK